MSKDNFKKRIERFPFSRKPHTIEDVISSVDCKDLLYTTLNCLNMLPYISSDRFAQDGFYADVFSEYKSYDDIGHVIYHPQFWITEYEGIWYLINNEGYDYARYVTKLHNFIRKVDKHIKYIPKSVL